MHSVKGVPDLVPDSACLAIAQRNQIQSPLLRMPAEISKRIHIYILDFVHTNTERFAYLHGDLRTWDRLELYRTSRQLFAETARVYFEQKIFPLTQRSFRFRRRFTWTGFAALFTPSQRMAIRHVMISWSIFAQPTYTFPSPIIEDLYGLRSLTGLKKLTVVNLPTWVTDNVAPHVQRFKDEMQDQDSEVILSPADWSKTELFTSGRCELLGSQQVKSEGFELGERDTIVRYIWDQVKSKHIFDE